jgi:hypothetical protein
MGPVERCRGQPGAGNGADRNGSAGLSVRAAEEPSKTKALQPASVGAASWPAEPVIVSSDGPAPYDAGRESCRVT